ncbi:hypothetical protein ACIQY5_16800 [Peribacillus frigoritolerans]|uniref:hypothetical protein n=1 Tax=Peribacillus frigoritolerans TaxID=450367 RepID=UPI003516B154
MNKSPVLAFLLSFLPGFGHFYLGRQYKGLFYFLATAGLGLGGLFLSLISQSDAFLAFSVIGMVFYFISIFDLVVTSLRNPKSEEDVEGMANQPETERFYVIILSFVPGLGHFQLGLMNRGLIFLISFLGFGIMVIFISVMTQMEGLLIFMALLPVIWIYSFFDSVQQLNKKQRGEELIDRTVLEDFEERRESGKKSKAVATLFAIFPGAGHLYLGLQKRGIQLMAGFLFAIYILDLLRLGFFFFLIPIIWFYSFFDGLQKASKMEEGPVEDTPIISGMVNHQKWLGLGLVGIGIYFLASNMIVPAIAPHLDEWIGSNLEYWFRDYFQKGLVCILLIGGGIKLLSGSKKGSVKEETK